MSFAEDTNYKYGDIGKFFISKGARRIIKNYFATVSGRYKEFGNFFGNACVDSALPPPK
jgi:hypothetical protein